MRILFITRKYPPSVGGMQNLSYQLISELKRHVEADVIAWGGSQKWLPFFLVWAFIRGMWLVWTKPVQAVHIGDPLLALLGLGIRWLGRVPVFTTAHGLDVTFASPVYQRMIRFGLRRLDGVVCISEYTRQECLKRGVLPARCTVITPGVVSSGPLMSRDESRKVLEDKLGIPLIGRKLLLSVGRLVKRKGVMWFVREVMPGLVAVHPEALLVVCGDGPLRQAIEAEIKTAHLEAHVLLGGKVDAETLRAAYSSADVFVMPNIAVPGDPEGFGLVVLEAGLAGTPVVAADLEGIRDAMAAGKTGLLVESGNAPAFLEAVTKTLAARAGLETREQIRQSSLERASWAAAGEHYLSAFQDWAAGSTAGGQRLR